MKLYLILDADDATKLGLLPTKREASREAKSHADQGRNVEVEEIDVAGNSKAVCEFISQRFGAAIFEN